MAKNGGGGIGSMKTILGWVLGIATIALTLLIMLILFGNLSGNVGFGNDATTITATNETNSFINTTGYTLSGFNTSWSSISLTDIWNVSASGTYNITIQTGNATVSAIGVVTNASTGQGLDNVSLTYTYSYSFPSENLVLTDNFIGNYTLGVSNTGDQFPVVGTMIGIALLLLILIGVLVFAMSKLAKMNTGAGSSGSFG